MSLPCVAKSQLCYILLFDDLVFDFYELSKMAIEYSDGVVVADKGVDKSLVDFAEGKNIPVLGYQEDFADAYESFYGQLFPEEAE